MKAIFKKVIIFSLLFFISGFIFAQENADDSTASEEPTKKTFLQRTDFVIQFDPTLYLSPESHKNKSNVINIYYPLTFGAIWPNDFMFAFQPTITFFIMEHLWFEKFALPAEIENRTTTTLSFMLNLPAVYSMTFKNQSKLQLQAGLGFFFRFGILSNGVNEYDAGYSGSAGKDVQLINQWFWENAHWLYTTFGISWLYPITSTIKVGPVLNAYVPMGTLIDQHNVQGLMFSIGIKLCR